MNGSTEKTVLMKCKHCGYEERGPQWVLDELNEFSEDKSYQMICPECDNTMFDNKKMMQASFWKTKPSRTPRRFLAWRVFLISGALPSLPLLPEFKA